MIVNRARTTVTTSRATALGQAPCSSPSPTRIVLERLDEAHRGIRRGEEADDRQAELRHGQEPARLVEQAPDAARAGAALVDELLDPAAPDRDEGDLGGDEEAFEQGQQDQDEDVEHQPDHVGVTLARPVVGVPARRGSGAAGSGWARVAHPGRHPDRELAGRDVLRDDRAGAGLRVVADRQRRAEHRVDAEEDPLADRRPVLRAAVVVGRDRAGADVRLRRRARRRRDSSCGAASRRARGGCSSARRSCRPPRPGPRASPAGGG